MYLGNKNLRAAGEKIAMTEKDIEEYIKCKDDIIYFAETYFYAQTIDDGRRLITLWDFQRKALKAMVSPPNGKRHICLMSSRQTGKGLISSIFLTHYALFGKDDNVAILANKESTAKLTLEKIKIAIQNFPLWLQKGVVDGGWNKNSIQLENGIKIFAASSSSDSIRGETCGKIFCDEAAHVASHIWDGFWMSVYSTISSGESSQIIMVSTPKGLNHFYDIYSKAVRGENEFYAMKVTWKDHPKRDAAWAERTKRDMGDIRAFEQEHNCSFIGSSNTLISPEYLEKIQPQNPIEYKYNGAMCIYEQPEEGVKYVVGCDPSRGTGGDASTVQVFKINNEKDIDQVAMYSNEYVDPETFASVCVGISEFYNDAAIMVENNDIGYMVCEKIWYDLECENLINVDPKGLGIRATRKSKLAGNLLLKKYIENGYLGIVDKKTHFELSRYVEHQPGVYHAASDSDHDDSCTAAIWALEFLRTEFYDPDSNGKSSVKSKDPRKSSDEDAPIFYSSKDMNFSNDGTYENYPNNSMDNTYNSNSYW